MAVSATEAALPHVSKYPARLHTTKVLRELRKRCQSGTQPLAICLQGTPIKYRDDTDRELPHRQESNFIYVTGSDIPDARLLAWTTGSKSAQNSDEDVAFESVLFIPEVDELDVMWSGMPLSPSEVSEALDISRVLTIGSFSEVLKELPTNKLHVLPGNNLSIDSIQTTDKDLLMACQFARLIKTPAEIDLIQQANDLSSKAHEQVMVESGVDMGSEYEASALFTYCCARKSAKGMAYETIAASGSSAGTLHYIKNHTCFPSVGPGSVLLLDAGCEYKYYASDITRTFPIGNGGKFTPEAREIYNIVLEMQEAAFRQMKPGADWEKIHIHMHHVVADGLLRLGILKRPSGSSIKDGGILPDDAKEGRDRQKLLAEILESGITTAFFPHGLGHMVGLDVHDSPLASRPNGPSKHPLAKYLRFVGILEEGHVITNEPGCYFNPFLIKPFEDSPYLDVEALKKYMPVGGVRIEDDVLITKHGFHNFTTAVKSVQEIEALCQSGSKRSLP